VPCARERPLDSTQRTLTKSLELGPVKRAEGRRRALSDRIDRKKMPALGFATLIAAGMSSPPRRYGVQRQPPRAAVVGRGQTIPGSRHSPPRIECSLPIRFISSK
jgi:hypothetical protein